MERMIGADFSLDALRSKFETVSVGNAHANRPQFLAYLDYVRITSGLEASVEVLTEYLSAGLLPALAALTTQSLTRRANEYGLAVDLMRDLRSKIPYDAFVASVYAESLLADARLDILLLEIGAIRECYSMKYTEETSLRLASTAATAGLWSESAFFLDAHVQQNQLDNWRRRVLRKRIELAHSYEAPSGVIPGLVINLGEDRRKFKLAQSLYGKMSIRIERLNGVRGSELSEYVLSQVVSESGSVLGRGAVGCALSHIAAWEKVATGEADYGLIVEDDGLPYSWQNIDCLVEDAGEFDVLYVNERMSSVPCQDVEDGVRSIWDTLGSRPANLRGWGGDGYILSRRGAERLLSSIAQDKIVGHIDGQLGSYGVRADQRPVTRAQSVGVACRRNMASQEQLVVKCLRFPLVASVNFGHSSIVSAGGHQ